MDWRILIKHNDRIFRAFKVLQNANEDITIIPHHSIYIDRAVLNESSIGDKLNVTTEENQATIDHFSAHAKTGQRHIKFKPGEFATEPINGTAFKGSQAAIPLISMVATTNRPEDGEPKKGKWFGFGIPDDTDHCIFDIYAIPLGAAFQFNFQHNISNEKMSVETFDYKIIPHRTMSTVVVIRTSNHNNCEIPYNVTVQQSEGKTLQIVRVAINELELQVSNLATEKINV